jgi:hypothetical protein
VLVDGSLRDARWYARVFGRLRADFPHYRIGVLLVHAARERIYERVARRAAITGRDVPRDVIDDAIEKVPQAFTALAPLADYAAVVENDDQAQPPRFRAPASLEGFAALWADIGAHACADAAAAARAAGPLSTSSSSGTSSGVTSRRASDVAAGAGGAERSAGGSRATLGDDTVSAGTASSAAGKGSQSGAGGHASSSSSGSGSADRVNVPSGPPFPLAAPPAGTHLATTQLGTPHAGPPLA